MAAARFIPGVCAVLGSSDEAGMTLTPFLPPVPRFPLFVAHRNTKLLGSVIVPRRNSRRAPIGAVNGSKT